MCEKGKINLELRKGKKEFSPFAFGVHSSTCPRAVQRKDSNAAVSDEPAPFVPPYVKCTNRWRHLRSAAL